MRTASPTPSSACTGSTVDASAHTITVANTTYRYRASTLNTANELVQFRVTSGSGTPTMLVEGYTFVPNSGVTIDTGTRTNYAVDFSGGVVTANLDLNVGAASSRGFAISASSRPIQRRVQLGATVTASDGSVARSFALVQVHANGSYAINSWGVDPDAGAPTTTTPPTTTTTTTTTTLPPTTTSTTTTTTTTTTVPPTTTTTLPPTGPCNPAANWTRDFGPGGWKAEYWNLPSSAFPKPVVPTTTPTFTDNGVAQVFKANDNGTPRSGVTADYYVARFTKTFNSTTACNISLQRGSDDGVRIKVNGVIVLEDWDAYAIRTTSVNNIPIVAGSNTIVFEYYEQTGQSGYSLEWKR